MSDVYNPSQFVDDLRVIAAQVPEARTFITPNVHISRLIGTDKFFGQSRPLDGLRTRTGKSNKVPACGLVSRGDSMLSGNEQLCAIQYYRR